MPGQRLLRTGLERQCTRCSDSLASSDCKEAILLPRAAGRDPLQKTYVKSYCSSSFLLDRALGVCTGRRRAGEHQTSTALTKQQEKYAWHSATMLACSGVERLAKHPGSGWTQRPGKLPGEKKRTLGAFLASGRRRALPGFCRDATLHEVVPSKLHRAWRAWPVPTFIHSRLEGELFLSVSGNAHGAAHILGKGSLREAWKFP